MKFVQFSKFVQKYIKTINKLYQHYKYLELINFEIEKLTKIYLDNYIDKDKQRYINNLRFHR